MKNSASPSRRASNKWLRRSCAGIKGDVLSLGSMSDIDCEGGHYRDYFKSASSYLTSDVSDRSEIVLDVRDMSVIPSRRYNCVFCSGVLEHVDDFMAGMREITRVLSPGGILLLGVPFRQPIHSIPDDFWRFTPFGIEYMLKNDYEIIEIKPIGNSVKNFAISYWVKAKKL
jgi:SAM-dependent methyltransferase